MHEDSPPTPSHAHPLSALAAAARTASRSLATLPRATKDAVLLTLADRLEAAAPTILEVNAQDIAVARAANLAPAKLKRLELTHDSIDQMCRGVRQIAAMNDPIGAVTRDTTVPSGLRITKVRAPLGVIAMIYEARPAVTIDAFALCFKAGNACILKGGKEAAGASRVMADIAREALIHHGCPEGAITTIPDISREDLKFLLTLDHYIDLVIPRGGTDLITFVKEHSRIPTIQHYRGVCHIFIDASADPAAAVTICTTAKTSAPAACNAAECLLIHESIAARFVPQLAIAFAVANVELRGCPRTCALAPGITPASEDDFGKEFLDLIIAVRIVANIDEALAHINRYSSNHTEAILTTDETNARRFTNEVQSSVSLINASTRFNDGYQLGLGAEIGISTSRIHAYGPMGLEELTTQRYIVYGDGQSR